MASEASRAAKSPKSEKSAESSSENAPQTLRLTDLRPAKGSRRAKLRVGRGRASGAGKTSNRGHNGEGQRSGNSRKRGFEGGQMPGYRQMPKINGFQLINRREWLEINVGDLESILLPEENELTYAMMRDGGLMKLLHDGIRLLGNGEVKRKLRIEAHYATPSARQKVEAAGGEIVLVSNKPAEA